MSVKCLLTLLFLVLLPTCLPGESGSFQQSVAPSNSDCLTCHGDRELRSEAGKSLYFDDGVFQKSVHGQLGLDCVSCHADLKDAVDFPHEAPVAPATCVECHDHPYEELADSIHSRRHPELGGRALGCSDCHDAHAIRPASDTESLTSPFHVQELCLRCHRTVAPRKAGRSADFVSSYEESIHSRALHKSGLDRSATCVTCHGSHGVKEVLHPASPVAKENIGRTCGSCHSGILRMYQQSVHGTSLASGNMEAPVCTDCHGEHTLEEATVQSSKVFARNVPETCGRCHEDLTIARQYSLATKRGLTFASSFHGVALKFGELRVANCASCHGYHEILPASDPASKIHPSRIPETCGSCHANAGTNWARGKVHVAEPQTDNYWVYIVEKFYTAFIVGMMGIFALFIFSDLWAYRRRKKEGSA